MKIHVDDDIFTRQRAGGIRKIWENLLRQFQTSGLEVTFGPDVPRDTDVFLPTYYRRTPEGIRSLVLVYDMIYEMYPLLSDSNPDAVLKREAIKQAWRTVAINPRVGYEVKKITGRAVNAVAMPGIDKDFGSTVLPSRVAQFKRQVTQDQPFVLVVGNRGLYKNVQTLYQAWQFFEGKDKYKLVCVGGEPDSLMDKAFDSRYPDTRRTFYDADQSTLEHAYCAASMLVYPSIMEGFGLPPLEALKCGCQVVCGETMHSILGDTAYYAEVLRPRSLAQQMNYAMDENRILHPKAPAGPMLAKYTWENMAEVIIQTIFYEEVQPV